MIERATQKSIGSDLPDSREIRFRMLLDDETNFVLFALLREMYPAI